MKLIEFREKYRIYENNDDVDKVVFEMGCSDIDSERVSEVLIKFKDVSEKEFKSNEVWVILFAWDISRGVLDDLKKCGFSFKKASSVTKLLKTDDLFINTPYEDSELEDSYVYLLKYNEYNYDLIRPIVLAIAGFDLAMDKSANINAYFISFSEKDILLNLYDDRGMELISSNKLYISKMKNKYSTYLL